MLLPFLPVLALSATGSHLRAHHQEAPAITLHVDATDVNRCLLRVTERLPAKAGKFAVHLPVWLPGHHSPSGTINNVIKFHAYVGEKEITWVRNPVDMFEIDLQNPPGTKEVELKFTVGTPPGTSQGAVLARLDWNTVVFLPDGHIDKIPVTPAISPPTGWTIYSALVQTSSNPSLTTYQTVDSEQLVDSPAELGKWAKSFEVGPKHYFDVLTEKESELDVDPALIDRVKNLVAETGALFKGSRHYRQYHFLTTFAPLAGAGLEHHECSEDGTGEDGLRRFGNNFNVGGLLAHEMFHSWNGKHRRPAGLITPDFTVPEQTGLLWVYEGMTQYYGNVLACRAGFIGKEQTRGDFANEIGIMATKPGHLWRPLEDTAAAASILRSGTVWVYDRRQQDYYSESVGIWLEADVTIRSLTKGAKSLDDFVLAFEGGPGGQPTTIGYQLGDVEKALEKVVHYDWHDFFQKRVYQVRTDLAESVSKSGWKLVFDRDEDTPEPRRRGGGAGFLYDLGLTVGVEGRVGDIELDTPVDKAGLAPGDTITQVNGKAFSLADLNEAVEMAKTDPKPIVLTVKRENEVLMLNVDYHGGRKSPRLVRIPNTTDYLSEIFASKIQH